MYASLNAKCYEAYQNPYKLAIAIFLFVMATTFPKYIEFLLDPSPITTYNYYFDKITYPLLPSKVLGNDSHGSKIAFRLTVPLIGKLLGIGSHGSGKDIVLLYALQSLLLLPFLFLLFKISTRFTTHKDAVLFTLGCSCTYLCKAFFWDYDFWFDGYAYFFMLAGMYFRNPIVLFVMLQLACWTDERAVIALPGIYLFRMLQDHHFIIPHRISIRGMLFENSSRIVLLAGLVYLSVRFWLSVRYHLHTPSGEQAGVSLGLIPYQLNNRLIGIALGFEGLWLYLMLAVTAYWKQNKLFMISVLIALVSQILVSYSVFDITRSLTYSFPIIIICFALYCKIVENKPYNFVMPITLICLLIPTQYLIYFARQIPMTIFSFYEIKLVLKTVMHFV